MTHIAVVGAGIAGLNAALTLKDAGLSCTIYEASHRVGGRMHSDALTWADGMVSEWYGEFIDAGHETMHQLIKRFGLRTSDLGGGRTDRIRSILFFARITQCPRPNAEPPSIASTVPSRPTTRV
jgi:monoamine oxidase